MKNLSTLKINQLVENLYLESTINKLYEDISDFDWMDGVKVVDPLLPFKEEHEYFIDISNLTEEEKTEILQFLENKDIVGYEELRHAYHKLGNNNYYIVHCALEANDYVVTKGTFCHGIDSYDTLLKDYEQDYYDYGVNVNTEYVDGKTYLNNIRVITNNNINESIFNNMGGSIKSLVKDVVNEYGLASKFITTFGTGISAFYGPVSRLLEGSGVSLDKKDIVLLIITAIAFMLNDTDFNKLKEVVKQKGLGRHVKSVANFINSSKKVIDSVTSRVRGTVYGLSDILGFTFLLVPVMDTLTKLIEDYGLTIDSVTSFLGGLAGAALAYTVKSIIGRINNKF